MKKFNIDAIITITPSDAATAIAETFQSAYGDRGSDETPEEHLARKVEEFILNIFVARQAEDSAQAVRVQTHDDIQKAATIRQRKDKTPDEATEPAQPKRKR